MDKYLVTNSAYERLWAEYKKYGSLIVAVDFDDTLYDFHGTGESYEMVKQLIRDLYSIGCKIIIWSGSEDVNTIAAYLKEQNIPWDLINENLQINGNWASGKDSRKVYANVYIDDRAGLVQVYKDLSRLFYEVTEKSFYRVCNENTKQGLWYNQDGSFTGLIHDKFNFCQNKDLKMDFDEELVGWLSAVKELKDLWVWFSKEDIKKLQEHGWYIYRYFVEDYKFYDKFQHFVIKQETSRVLNKIEL